MNVFQIHSGIVDDYATYIRSFLNIADPTILEVVEGELSKGKLWPEPLLQFNPSFEMAGSVAALARPGSLYPDIANICGVGVARHTSRSFSHTRRPTPSWPKPAPPLISPRRRVRASWRTN